jgi:hypothetical protein
MSCYLLSSSFVPLIYPMAFLFRVPPQFFFLLHSSRIHCALGCGHILGYKLKKICDQGKVTLPTAISYWDNRGNKRRARCHCPLIFGNDSSVYFLLAGRFETKYAKSVAEQIPYSFFPRATIEHNKIKVPKEGNT